MMAAATSFKDNKLYMAIEHPTTNTWKTVQDEIKSNEDTARLTGEYDETYFHLIAIHCRPKTVDYLLPVVYQLAMVGVDVNLVDSSGHTALALCLLNRADYLLVDALLKVGADPQVDWEIMGRVEDPLVTTVIHRATPGLWNAAVSGDCTKVESLLDSWFSVDLVCDGKNLLAAAAAEEADAASDEMLMSLRRRAPVIRLAHAALASDLEATRMLLADAERDEGYLKKVDVNTKVADRLFEDGSIAEWPLLAEVIRLGHFEVALALVEAGADVNVAIHRENTGDRETTDDRKTRTPLFVWALTREQKLDRKIGLLSLIMESADISLVESHSDLLYGLWSNECSISDLHKSFDRGLSLSARNSDGYTIRELIFLETMQFDVGLLKTSLQFVDQYVRNLVVNEDIRALEKLACDGYEYVNATDGNGLQTMLDVSIQQQKVKSIQFYQRLPQFQKSWQLLHKAIEKGNLFEAREQINESSVVVRDRAGRNALHKAILYERQHIVKIIVKDFAKLTVNGLDNMKRSPLHYAYCYQDSESFVDELISAGASQTLLDMEGRSASEYARHPWGYKFLETERSRYYGHRVFLIDRYLSFVNVINGGGSMSATPSIDRIDALIDSLHPYVLNDLDQILPNMKHHRYRPLLFLCVDKDLEDVAIRLIKRGASYKVKDTGRKGTKMAPTTLLEAALKRHHIKLINAIKYQMTLDAQQRRVEGIYDAATSQSARDDFDILTARGSSSRQHPDDDLQGSVSSVASEWSYSTVGRSTRNTLLQSGLSRSLNGWSGNPGEDTALDHQYNRQQQPTSSSVSTKIAPKTASTCTCL